MYMYLVRWSGTGGLGCLADRSQAQALAACWDRGKQAGDETTALVTCLDGFLTPGTYMVLRPVRATGLCAADDVPTRHPNSRPWRPSSTCDLPGIPTAPSPAEAACACPYSVPAPPKKAPMQGRLEDADAVSECGCTIVLG